MKAHKALKKAIKHLSQASGSPYDELYSLFGDLLNLSKEFYTYPKPNSFFAPIAPLIYVQVLPEYRVEPNLVGDDKPYQEKTLRKKLKHIRKAQGRFTQAFNKMEKKNKDYYSELDLHKPLDVVQAYAREIEQTILGRLNGHL